MKRLTIFPAVILFIFTACNESEQAGSDELILVDVTAKYPKKEVVLQDILDIEYILLETNDEFINQGYIRAIGKDIIVVRNYIRDGNLFIFDRSGKALKKINRRGGAAEEYANATEVILDEEKNEMFIYDHFKTKIVVYDTSGNFKRSLQLPQEISYEGIYNFDPDHLIVNNMQFDYDDGEADIQSFYILSKQDGSITREIKIPFEQKTSFLIIVRGVGISFPRTLNPLLPYRGDFILTEQSSDTIYQYSSTHRMSPLIVRTPSVHTIEPQVFLFPAFLTDDYCVMAKVEKEWDFQLDKGFPITNLMYDRQQNTLYECTFYNDDYTGKIPIEITSRFMNEEVAFWKILDVDELKEAYKDGKLKGPLKEIVAHANEDSNPILMLAKYKK